RTNSPLCQAALVNAGTRRLAGACDSADAGAIFGAASVTIGTLVAGYFYVGAFERCERRWVVDLCPDRDRNSAVRPQCAAHLSQRRRGIGEELKTLLARRDVEVGVEVGVVDRQSISD